jgi:hypothetical protein
MNSVCFLILYREAIYLNKIPHFLFQEMVIDKVNGQEIPRYLAYDIIKFDGCDVGRSAFYPVRLGCIEASFGYSSLFTYCHHSQNAGNIPS